MNVYFTWVQISNANEQWLLKITSVLKHGRGEENTMLTKKNSCIDLHKINSICPGPE